MEDSTARLVAAVDAERRELERRLHDGVRQQLVAVAVSLQLLDQLADTDPVAAKTLLGEIRNDVREALDGVAAGCRTDLSSPPRAAWTRGVISVSEFPAQVRSFARPG